MSLRCWSWSPCVLAVFFWTQLSGGATELRDLTAPVGDYSIRIWQTEEGLPQNSVTAITQTHDGYLWIGTYGGLTRFDGDRFENFDAVTTPALQDGRIVSLYEDVEGVLWIGHDSGRLTSYRAGRFDADPESEAGAGQKICALNADSKNLLWILRNNGLLESLSPNPHKITGPITLAPKNLGLTRTTDGRLYVSRDGEVFDFAEGELRPVDFGTSARTGYVMGLGASSDGGLWVVRDFRVRKWTKKGWTEDRGICPWGETSLTTVLELRGGALAVGTMNQGVYLLYANGRVAHFDRDNGLPQNWVRYLYEDRESVLWIGAGSGGLVALRPAAFATVNAPDQWQGRAVLSVIEGQDGALWIGTEGAGVYRFDHGRWSHYSEEEGLDNLFVWSLTKDAAGEIWAGTWAGGIYRFHDGHFLRIAAFDGLDVPVLALHFAPEDGSLWIGTGNGVVHFESGRVALPFQKAAGDSGAVCAVASDHSGSVWFGVSDGGGLGQIQNGQLTLYRKKDGLSSEFVQCLLADDDGTLWIGTLDRGLIRLKQGKFSSIGPNEGLASKVICHLSDDGRGYLWISTHHGILRVAKRELNRCADGLDHSVEGKVYDRNDGLPTLEFSGGLQSAGCRTTDGRLWFASSKGLVSVDPAAIHLNPLPPPVSLNSVRVDTHLFQNGSGDLADLRLRSDHEHVEFRFSALSLLAPSKVLFKYRLNGLEKSWTEGGTKHSAVYSHLPPGNYSFQVIACNNDGVWNLQGATQPFAVLPFFWQTGWFRFLVALAILFAVAWAVRQETHRRMQARLDQLERQHALERERARIAQDIHDDIGSSLTRITMLSQSVRVESPAAPGASVLLERIYETSREVTRALDEIVWAVDPQHDTLDSLIGYMGKFAQDFLGASGIRCRLDVPIKLPDWPLTTEARHNLFLAFKETLNNTVKHAAAKEVRISLEMEARSFALSVRDDGCGFEPSLLKAQTKTRAGGGRGLPNVARRLAQIGGSCKLTTEPGCGTIVTFNIKAPESAASWPVAPSPNAASPNLTFFRRSAHP